LAAGGVVELVEGEVEDFFAELEGGVAEALDWISRFGFSWF
tara:strand:+ start:9067 stop:9189 length:123 start_codon:yes stop_codon:yes gene_type:complete